MRNDKEARLSQPEPDGGLAGDEQWGYHEPQPLPKVTLFEALFAIYSGLVIGTLAYLAWLLGVLAWQAIKRYFQIY